MKKMTSIDNNDFNLFITKTKSYDNTLYFSSLIQILAEFVKKHDINYLKEQKITKLCDFYEKYSSQYHYDKHRRISKNDMMKISDTFIYLIKGHNNLSINSSSFYNPFVNKTFDKLRKNYQYAFPHIKINNITDNGETYFESHLSDSYYGNIENEIAIEALMISQKPLFKSEDEKNAYEKQIEIFKKSKKSSELVRSFIHEHSIKDYWNNHDEIWLKMKKEELIKENAHFLALAEIFDILTSKDTDSCEKQYLLSYDCVSRLMADNQWNELKKQLRISKNKRYERSYSSKGKKPKELSIFLSLYKDNEEFFKLVQEIMSVKKTNYKILLDEINTIIPFDEKSHYTEDISIYSNFYANIVADDLIIEMTWVRQSFWNNDILLSILNIMNSLILDNVKVKSFINVISSEFELYTIKENRFYIVNPLINFEENKIIDGDSFTDLLYNNGKVNLNLIKNINKKWLIEEFPSTFYMLNNEFPKNIYDENDI